MENTPNIIAVSSKSESLGFFSPNEFTMTAKFKIRFKSFQINFWNACSK
jgi:hypothetical protein